MERRPYDSLKTVEKAPTYITPKSKFNQQTYLAIARNSKGIDWNVSPDLFLSHLFTKRSISVNLELDAVAKRGYN